MEAITKICTCPRLLCELHGDKPYKECVGCDATENLEKCDGTMCRNCWIAENEEPNLAEE